MKAKRLIILCIAGIIAVITASFAFGKTYLTDGEPEVKENILTEDIEGADDEIACCIMLDEIVVTP